MIRGACYSIGGKEDNDVQSLFRNYAIGAFHVKVTNPVASTFVDEMLVVVCFVLLGFMLIVRPILMILERTVPKIEKYLQMLPLKFPNPELLIWFSFGPLVMGDAIRVVTTDTIEWEDGWKRYAAAFFGMSMVGSLTIIGVLMFLLWTRTDEMENKPKEKKASGGEEEENEMKQQSQRLVYVRYADPELQRWWERLLLWGKQKGKWEINEESNQK